MNLKKPSLPSSDQDYDLLVSGLNRIKFLRQKQERNKYLMPRQILGLFTSISNNQKTSKGSQAEEQFKQKPEKTELTKDSVRQMMMKVYINKGKGNLSRRKTQKAHYSNRENSLQIQFSENKNRRIQELEVFKKTNYKEMRRQQRNLEKMKQERLINQVEAFRKKKQKAAFDQLSTRKRLERQYFSRLESIRKQKEDKRHYKTRQTMNELSKMKCLQEEEQGQLSYLQNSLVLKDQLRSLIENQCLDCRLQTLYTEESFT